jgi:precorrin-6A/cobalt-precorrin-6A reductase
MPPDAEVLLARGPFTVADEAALLRKHRIDVLVTKDSGAAATAAKLTAARDLGLPVVVVRRPPLPEGVTAVPDAAGALARLRFTEFLRGRPDPGAGEESGSCEAGQG